MRDGLRAAALLVAAAGRFNPMFAGAAMALSSVFVVSNSVLLRRSIGTSWYRTLSPFAVCDQASTVRSVGDLGP